MTGSSWRASPQPLPLPVLPLSSPLWTEPPQSSCLPTTDPADMGTAGATQLCWVILSFLLLRGKRPLPLCQQFPSRGWQSWAPAPSFRTHTAYAALHPGLCPGEIPEPFMKEISWTGRRSLPGKGKIAHGKTFFVGKFPG